MKPFLSRLSTLLKLAAKSPPSIKRAAIGGYVLAIALAIPLLGQETGPAVRVPVPGELVRSISIRVTAGQPRFVVASRIAEERIVEDAFSFSLQPPAEIVDYFERAAAEQIAKIDRVCRLDERQVAKLKLAAMGDMSRIARESREVQLMYSGIAVRDVRDGRSAQDDVARVNLHLVQGVLREGSMFLMVLRSVLTFEQNEQLSRAQFAELTERWPVELSDGQWRQLWRVACTNSPTTAPPLMWNEKECRSMVAKLPISDLASFLEVSQVEELLSCCKP